MTKCTMFYWLVHHCDRTPYPINFRDQQEFSLAAVMA